jgi:hypothetical protein
VGTSDISTELFLSLLSFHPKLSLSSSHFLFVLSALSSLFALSVFGSSVVGLAGVGLVLRWLGFLLGFLLKHETGWLRLAGVVVVLRWLGFLLVFFFFFSQICTGEASHHHL